jgi:hypothetical protein
MWASNALGNNYVHLKCGLCIAEVHVKMQLSIHIDFISLFASTDRWGEFFHSTTWCDLEESKWELLL